MNIFDIVGPVMIGPSSSHTAGAVRIGRIARELLNGKVVRAEVKLYGSFAKTYKGHGTDRAIAGGILGMAPDDERIRSSLDMAKEEGVEITFSKATGNIEHPNTAMVYLYGENGEEVSVLGASVGGGNILISEIDGMHVRVTGQYDTLIVVHEDIPGIVGKVAEFLGNCGINVNNMALSRTNRGGTAVLCIEVDGHTDLDITAYLSRFNGVKQCTMIDAS